MMTDPIADLLTRIRNALRNRAGTCNLPGSRLKVAVLDVLKREGYIDAYTVQGDGPRSIIEIDLKYGPEGEQVITKLRRYSKPGWPERILRAAQKCQRVCKFQLLDRGKRV